MKKLFLQSVILIISSLLITSSLVAQSPQGIPYQAVMRNADGSVMASSAVNLTFMIHDGTSDGTVVYQESHSLTSNAQGLVSCVVGNGVVSQGNFNNINWGNGAKFLQVLMNGTDLGTQQMLSVPYALYAENVGVRVSATGDTLIVGGQSLIVPGVSAANLPSLYTQGTGVTDIDGNFYPSIIINGQEWMQQNLAVTKYRNGEPIPTGLDDATWSSITSGAYAIYNNDAINNTLYGKLYNWYAVNDSRGLCPTGWHVPSDFEWTTLESNLGGNSIAGVKLKATDIWLQPPGGNNISGWTAFPSGYRYVLGWYSGIGNFGFWWSDTAFDTNSAWCRSMYDIQINVERGNEQKKLGFSVRCVRD